MTARPRKSPAAVAEAPKLDFAKWMAARKPLERSFPICGRGDLAAEFDRVEDELRQAAKKPKNSLAGTGLAPLMERLDQIQDEMREFTYPFKLRALKTRHAPGDDDSRPTWDELAKQHPPREKEDGSLVTEDLMAGGLNRETFLEPLLRFTIVDPVMSDEQFEEFIAGLSDGQYEQLAQAAWDCNQGQVDIPFSRVASLIRQGSSDE